MVAKLLQNLKAAHAHLAQAHDLGREQAGSTLLRLSQMQMRMPFRLLAN